MDDGSRRRDHVGEIMGGDHEGGIIKEEWRRNHEAENIEETWRKKHGRGNMEDESRSRNHGGVNHGGESWRRITKQQP